jgi:hypothetical protein
MNIKLCRAVLVALTFQLISVVAARADALPEVYQLPVWVDAVVKVCPWKSESAEGYIRLIRREHDDGHHGLYVQWIREGIAGAPTEAVSTLAVEELDSEYMVRMELPTAVLGRDACRLKARAEDMVNERRYEFDFLLRGPGELTVNVTRKMDGGV